MSAGNPDRRLGAQVPRGWRLLAVKRYSELESENHRFIVLAYSASTSQWVTWAYNSQTDGCGQGNYFQCRDSDADRWWIERKAWADFIERGHTPDLHFGPEFDLQRGADSEPVVDDFPIHAADRTMEAQQREERDTTEGSTT